MKQFNQSFYTDDFDQEMLDFLEKEGYSVSGKVCYSYPNLSDKYLKYYDVQECFWTTDVEYKYGNPTFLTKQQFKEKIGMTEKENTSKQSNTFTKSMLVSGEHIVKLRDGSYNLVMKDRIVYKGRWVSLEHLTDNLIHYCVEEDYTDEDLDVIAVYSLKKHFTLNNLEDGKELTLIWQRESSEKQKQREVIQTLEEDLKRAQKALEEAKVNWRKCNG